MQTALSQAIATADRELSVELASHKSQIMEAKRLRYRIYCEERGFEAGQDGLEQDEYDGNARHVLVRSRRNGRVYGTVRLVLGSERLQERFPMERICADFVLKPLPRSTTAEISRFALTRDRDGLSPAASALLRLHLIQGTFAVAGEAGLTHFCAIMERTLLRLLRSSAMYFLPVGPTVEYRGIRQPAIFALADGLERMRRENAEIWGLLTKDGTLWSPAKVAALEPAFEMA